MISPTHSSEDSLICFCPVLRSTTMNNMSVMKQNQQKVLFFSSFFNMWFSFTFSWTTEQNGQDYAKCPANKSKTVIIPFNTSENVMGLTIYEKCWVAWMPLTGSTDAFSHFTLCFCLPVFYANWKPKWKHEWKCNRGSAICYLLAKWSLQSAFCTQNEGCTFEKAIS